MKKNIIITMAGKGTRFVQAGYSEPKYEISVHGKHLFDWSMYSLKNFINHDDLLVFVCLSENNSRSFLERRCKALDILNYEIVEIDEITDGQATSAYVSRSHWKANSPLLIYNIDTYVKPEALKPESIAEGSDGWIPCFKAEGNHWSFVALGDEGWATRLAEKERISPFATIGLYYFSKASDYAEAYEKYYSKEKDNMVKGERYIAPLYNQMISRGKKLSISDISPNDVHVLGTPRELEAFRDSTDIR